MSASREKKLRQDQTASGYVDPKAEKELEEKKLEDTRKYGTPVVKEPSTDPADYGDMGTTPAWKSFEKDPETGYYIDPNTNELLDPETGNPVGTNYDPIPSE